MRRESVIAIINFSFHQTQSNQLSIIVLKNINKQPLVHIFFGYLEGSFFNQSVDNQTMQVNVRMRKIVQNVHLKKNVASFGLSAIVQV